MIRVADIQRAVCEHYAIDRDTLLGPIRTRKIAEPRQVGMYLARKHTRLSNRQIATLFKRCDHSTVCHAAKKVAGNLQSFGRDVEAIRQRLAA
jgi:chromosomal replication initiator protein